MPADYDSGKILELISDQPTRTKISDGTLTRSNRGAEAGAGSVARPARDRGAAGS